MRHTLIDWMGAQVFDLFLDFLVIAVVVSTVLIMVFGWGYGPGLFRLLNGATEGSDEKGRHQTAAGDVDGGVEGA